MSGIAGWDARPTELLAHLLALLRPALGPSDLALVEQAAALALRLHDGQTRDDGTPYILHPLRAAVYLVGELGVTRAEPVAAMLLHDVVEDSGPAAMEQIRELSAAVADTVAVLTKPPRQGRTHAEVNAEYIPRLQHADMEVRLLKLVDRLDNVRDLPNCGDAAKRGRMLKETIAFYLPFLATVKDPFLRSTLESAFGAAVEQVQSSGR